MNAKIKLACSAAALLGAAQPAHAHHEEGVAHLSGAPLGVIAALAVVYAVSWWMARRSAIAAQD